MKKCNKCHIEKDSSEFYKHKSSKDRLQASCIVCQSAYSRGYMRARKDAEQSVVVDAKVCKDCGLKKPISQFGKRSTSLDKHLDYCKPCWRDRSAAAMRRFYAKQRSIS
mgnify:CR=1 FL=1